MPWYRPTLEQIRKRVRSDLEYELQSHGARIPGTVESAIVEAIAGVSHGLHGRLAWIATNAFAQSAEDPQMARIAALFGVFQRQAERATGTAFFFRSQVAGQVVPKELRLKVADVEVEVLEDTPFIGINTSVTVPIRAVKGGKAGNLVEGTELVAVNPVAGISSKAQVKEPGMQGGVDAETPLELRTRLLERLGQPPSGGGPGSYIGWAKEVEGVTRVWEFGREPKLGHVTVLFMRDNDEDPFPSVPEIAEVEARLLEYAPHHLAGLHVDKPIDKPLSLTIEITPDTPELRAAVVTSIKNMLAAEAAPPKADGATFYKSRIANAIGDVDGVEDYKLTAPAGDITVDKFELLTLADPDVQVTWV